MAIFVASENGFSPSECFTYLPLYRTQTNIGCCFSYLIFYFSYILYPYKPICTPSFIYNIRCELLANSGGANCLTWFILFSFNNNIFFSFKKNALNHTFISNSPKQITKKVFHLLIIQPFETYNVKGRRGKLVC